MTDVSLSDEQQLLVDTCARVVERAGVRPPAPERPLARDDRSWAALVDGGLVAMRAPERLGGAGASAVDAALVAEQLARGPVPVPYLGTAFALEALVLAADRSAEAVAAVDAVVGGTPHGLVLDGFLLAPAATGVALDAEPGRAVLGVDTGVDGAGTLVLGVGGRALDATDLARPLAEADLGASGPAGLLDREALDRWTAFALALVCADLLGAASATLDAAVAHARDRVQFGRPVGSFQAVQHLCADALVSVEAARSATWYAAWAVDAEPPPVALEAARIAKAHCSEAALEVAEAAVQVWGGLAITWECPAHLFQRRALQSRRLLGDETHQLEVLADHLLAPSAEEVGS